MSSAAYVQDVDKRPGGHCRWANRQVLQCTPGWARGVGGGAQADHQCVDGSRELFGWRVFAADPAGSDPGARVSGTGGPGDHGGSAGVCGEAADHDLDVAAGGSGVPRQAPEGTFYAFGSIKKLPAPLNNGLAFMHEAFKHKVLTAARGEFLDVNPHRRPVGAVAPGCGLCGSPLARPRRCWRGGLLAAGGDGEGAAGAR